MSVRSGGQWPEVAQGQFSRFGSGVRSALRVVVVVAVAAVAAVGLLTWTSLPQYFGEVRTDNAHPRVDIWRDSHGIPHVESSSEEGALYGLGYAHAQDRLWQMESLRRQAAGTLAEIFGVDALESDRFFRTLGLRRAASAAVKALDQKTLRNLQAYTDGINAQMEASWIKPPEFLMLGYRPRAWEIVDSLCVLKLLAWTQSVNYEYELFRSMAVKKVGAASLARLFGEGELPEPGMGEYFSSGPPKAAATHFPFRESRTEISGSNSWSVSGERARGGRPLLANDPHLALGMPGLWYLAHLGFDKQDVVGATVPGVPGVLAGHNTHVAWGLTNGMADTQDLFVERESAEDHGRYVTPDGARSYAKVHERIAVRGRDPVDIVVRFSRHGPIISDLLDAPTKRFMREGYSLALRAVVFEQNDSSIQFPMAAARAVDADALVQATELLVTPQLNLVYADVYGKIGRVVAGKIPRRAQGKNQILGRAPVSGWEEEYDWNGYFAAAELPTLRNPSSHEVIAANQNPHGAESGDAFLSSDWPSAFRVQRIHELLQESGSHDRNTFAQIQNDTLSGTARRILPLLLRLGIGGTHKTVVDGLRGWNEDMAEDSKEAAVFAAWSRELPIQIFRDEFGDHFPDAWPFIADKVAAVLAAPPDGLGRWCDDVGTPARESCTDAATRALDAAVKRLEEKKVAGAGSDWGGLHELTLDHTFLVGGIFDRLLGIRMRGKGELDSVNASGLSFTDDENPFAARYGATYRMVFDASRPKHAEFITCTGQSGHLMSQHYRDLAPLWKSGRLIVVSTDWSEIRGEGTPHLVLLQAQARHPFRHGRHRAGWH